MRSLIPSNSMPMTTPTSRPSEGRSRSSRRAAGGRMGHLSRLAVCRRAITSTIRCLQTRHRQSSSSPGGNNGTNGNNGNNENNENNGKSNQGAWGGLGVRETILAPDPSSDSTILIGVFCPSVRNERRPHWAPAARMPLQFNPMVIEAGSPDGLSLRDDVSPSPVSPRSP